VAAKPKKQKPDTTDAPKTFNDHVLAVIESLPEGGGYTWPTDDPRAGGCIEDVVHDGVTLLKASPTYCCGLTLEVLFRAYKAAGVTPPFDATTARRIQTRWFVGHPTYRKGPANALPRYGLGVETSTDPQPGDFAQLWRDNGSGHSVVVVDYDKKTGKLTYWSTQASTKGIGTRTETPKELYAARVVLPAG
jgi:hypothetical protein